MKKKIAVFFAVAAVFLLVSCATMMGPRQVQLPLYQLQEALSHRFPFNNRYLELLDVNISNPRLALQPGTNRVMISLDALVAPPFLAQSWNGALTLSGGLRFDPALNGITLADPRVENFNVAGLDPAYARSVTKIGSLVAEEALKGVPLYTFRPDQLSHGGTRFFPSQIVTTANALVVTFEPVK